MIRQLTEEQIEAALARSNRKEREYRRYASREGRGPVNEAPDGCYFCGTSSHHSSDCSSNKD